MKKSRAMIQQIWAYAQAGSFNPQNLTGAEAFQEYCSRLHSRCRSTCDGSSSRNAHSMITDRQVQVSPGTRSKVSDRSAGDAFPTS